VKVGAGAGDAVHAVSEPLDLLVFDGSGQLEIFNPRFGRLGAGEVAILCLRDRPEATDHI
jgi:hypothetical protein